jgi:hypothetical protein
MKNNGRWFQVAAIALCLGLCTSACQHSSENANTSKAENAHEMATPTPVPVQRKDVRITGLMIGTGVDARNEITNPGAKYAASDSIYALVRTDGSGPEATITLRCKDNAENVVFEESKKITPSGEGAIVFTLTAAKSFSAGEYHLMGLLDEYPEMAVSFEVSE